MANPKFACSYGEAQEMKQKIQELSDVSSSLRRENGELKDEVARLTALNRQLMDKLSALPKTAPPKLQRDSRL